ncbi:Formate/nitrite transporter [Ceraceosorus guamensis]|uniref:Formate/nitrite transporter n=1 Tax=Ceraceosorus guamensis TaxID=1522189 RepID=A0A316WA72_9BASI|nr:Formate/nitrite transporter [Ceraceosorus guamensis]PWN44873.1 Formate/nitrite transporter [Ceraceosorus guamensis]
MSAGPQMITLEQATWAFIDAAPRKHTAPWGVRFVKAAMAGVLLSLGGTLVQVLSADPWLTTNAPGLLKLIQASYFPIGLVMIVLLQADLVTGNMAIFIAGTVKRKVPIWAFLVDWSLCFIGNLIGALVYAVFIVHFGTLYTPAMSMGAANIANAKVVSINFREVFLRGIGCNYAVVAAVFLASLGKDVISKIVASYLPILFFVGAGYEHVVANMFLVIEGLLTKESKATVGRYIWNSIIPSFLGNILGAAFFILPLVYIHGRDEFNPASFDLPTTSHDERAKIGGGSPDGTFAGPQDHNEQWRKDVEKTAAAQ